MCIHGKVRVQREGWKYIKQNVSLSWICCVLNDNMKVLDLDLGVVEGSLLLLKDF